MRPSELNGPGSAAEALETLVAKLTRQNAQLEEALQSRIAIEQAKGVLAERLQVAPDEAFFFLRRAARSHRLKLHDLARQVVASRQTPEEIREVLERLGSPPS